MVIVITSGEEGNDSVIKWAVKKLKAVVKLIRKSLITGPIELGGYGGGGRRQRGGGEESRERKLGGRREKVVTEGLRGGDKG